MNRFLIHKKTCNRLNSYLPLHIYFPAIIMLSKRCSLLYINLKSSDFPIYGISLYHVIR